MPAMRKFFVTYRSGDKMWFVLTKEGKITSTVSGPYPTKAPAMAYATDRAKSLGTDELPTQVLSQEKGKRRFNTESTHPRSADPRNIRGTSRKLKLKK